MTTYAGAEVRLHSFLTSALDGEVSFTPRSFRPPPRGKSSCTLWMGHNAGLDDPEKGKISWYPSGIELRFLGGPTRSLVTIPTELSRIYGVLVIRGH